MKVYKILIFTVFACLLTVVSISAQQATAEKKPYQNVVVEKFTVRDGSEFPVDKVDALSKSIMNTLTRSNRFKSVAVAGETASAEGASTESADLPTLKITGEILKYVKGNRAARYVIGMGVGATKLIADIKFIDVKTGEVVYQQTVDGDVTAGFFGGDSDDAKGGVASEIISVMKKNGLAGDKIKKNK